MRTTPHFSFTSAFTSAFTSLLLLSSFSLSATTWNIGPTRTYKDPSEVCSLVRSGDIVEIDSGTYAIPLCRWTVDDLVIRGNGKVILQPAVPETQKAMFEVISNYCRVQNITFTGARSTNDTSCAILARGRITDIVECLFTENYCGVRATTFKRAEVLITNCEFDRSGGGPNSSGAVVADTVLRLILASNYMHGASHGREIHSRAMYTYLRNNRIESDEDSAAALLTCSNRGLVCLVGNVLLKRGSGERLVMEYGADTTARKNIPEELILAYNTIVCDRPVRNVVEITGAPLASVRMVNNIVVGAEQLISAVDSADTMHNVHVDDGEAAGLRNATARDLHLLSTSPARDKAVPPGMMTRNSADNTTSQELIVMGRQYLHPSSSEPRLTSVDMGAFAFDASTSISTQNIDPATLGIAPNPATTSITLSLPPSLIGTDVIIMDMQGSEVGRIRATHTTQRIHLDGLTAGMYAAHCGTYSALFCIVP